MFFLNSGQTIVLEERQEGNSEVSHIPLKIQVSPYTFLFILQIEHLRHLKIMWMSLIVVVFFPASSLLQGLTPSGYLRAVDDASEAYELHPDGNR